MKLYRSEPLTEPEKRYLRKQLGTKQRFSQNREVSDKPKEREFLCPTRIGETIARSKKRGFNGCRLSHEKRVIVLEKAGARLEFLRSMGVKI